MLFARYQPCQASWKNEFWGQFAVPNWGPSTGPEKNAFNIHLWKLRSLTWGPKNDFWVPIGAPFAVQILDKRHLGMNACTLGVPRRLQDELKTVQALKIDPAWYQKFDLLNMLCPSCVQTCSHPAAFCRPLHSTDSIKAQSTAQQQLTRHSCTH